MTIEELEAKLVQARITNSVAKMIAVMALAPSIERHEKSWSIPISLAIVSNFIKHDSLRGIVGAVINEQSGAMSRQFVVVTDLSLVPGNAYLSYRFSPQFIQWAGLTQSVPAKPQ